MGQVKFQAIAIALLFIAAGKTAWSQDIERLKPRLAESEAAEAEFITPPAPEVDESAGEEVLGTIRGLALVGHPDQVSVDLPPDITGVAVLDPELVVPIGVIDALRPFVDSPLSVKSISEISRATVLAYRAADLPVVDVGFPEQNVSNGVLQLVVVVGKAGDIRVEGAEHFAERIYLRSFRTGTGDLLRHDVILEDLRFLNRSAYRTVRLNYTPGEEFGESDVILEVEERSPWSGYFSYEDTGNELLGVDRFLFGVEWGNVAGLDHTLAYQYTTNVEFDGLHGHSWIYRAPLPRWRHELRLLGAFVKSDASFKAAGETFQTGGESSQVTASYVIPLPEVLGYEQDLLIGYDFKSTNNNLEFGGIRMSDSTAEIHQFSAGQTLNRSNPLGRQRIFHRFVWSPGELSGHNSDASFRELRALSSASYFYWSGEITQAIDLPGGFTFVGDVEAQLSNENLLPSESLILGGVGSVRGFEQNITRADQGLIMNLELYTPPVSPLHHLGIDGGEDRLRGFGFFDYALARNVNRLPGENREINLGGVGFGLDYQWMQNLSLRAAYGWQTAKSGIFDDGETGRWHLSGTVRF